MKALIDMDLVCFRSAASAEEDSLKVAISRMKKVFKLILDKTNTKDYRAFLTGSSNFRKDIDPEYKANRTAPKPKHLEGLRDYAITKLKAEVAHQGLEADDMMSIYQDKVGNTTIICSLDKDMLQVPGLHYQWGIGTSKWTKPEAFITQTELEGLRLFYEQCLKGDVADNVKGIKGIGEAKARNALSHCTSEEEMLEVVLRMYDNDKDLFLKNARCLWVLRSIDDSYLERYNATIQEQTGRECLGDSAEALPEDSLRTSED